MTTYIVYRNILLSLMKEIQDIVPAGVSVVDETEEELITSTIGIYPGYTRWESTELGNREGADVFSWMFAIYANTAMQRDSLSLLLYNILKNWVFTVVDYSSAEAVLGKLYIKDAITINPRRAPKEVVDKLRYFALISFQSTFQEA